MNDYKEKLSKQADVLTNMGYTVAYICLYGSQNYGLDIYNEEYQSDVDMKAIVVPTLDDLLKNSKPVSVVYDTEWGQVDVKDIRSYMQTLLKANPAYIETLFTEHYLVNEKFEKEFELILEKADSLVDTLKAQFIRAMYGMMCEKQKAMCHPYPSIAHKIEKFGYDGKQAHHIYRLLLMMKDYFLNLVDIMECFYPENDEVKLLMDLKLNKLPLEQVALLTDEWMAEAEELKNKVLSIVDESKIDYSIKDRYIELSNDVIRKSIVKECASEIINKLKEDYK